MKKIISTAVHRGMRRDDEYVNYLQRVIVWRLCHERTAVFDYVVRRNA